jgi:PAS domain S-box-containing protein
VFDKSLKINLKKERPATQWPLVLLVVIVFTIAPAGGVFYYLNQKTVLLENTKQRLSAISDLKIKQIAQWRKERIGDGTFISQSEAVSEFFSGYLFSSGDDDTKKNALRELQLLSESYDYRNALLLDRDLNVRLFYPGKDTTIGDYLKPKLPKLLEDGKVVLTDFHQTGKVSFVHLDLIVPLHFPGGEYVMGLLVLRIDPEKVLYPLIESWPVSSKTSEALLVHQEGDEVVFLNKTKGGDDKENTLRLPVDNDNLPAAMALKGIKETIDGIDYKGVQVIAVMNKVPESPWFMVTKTDRKEALAELYFQGKEVILVVFLILLTTAFFAGFMIRIYRLRYYKSKYESEIERLALSRHYEYILKNANDIIFLVNSDYIIVEANDKAVETYGYQREDLIGAHIRTLRADETDSAFDEDVRQLDTHGNSTFITVHKRRDNSTFPIEISARKIEIQGEAFYQSICRDITERKVAEESLKASEERFRKLFEESHVGMVMTGKDMGLVKANNAFCRMLGYSEEEILGLTFRHFTHQESIGQDEVGILELVSKKVPIYRTEKRYVRKDGVIIWGSTTILIIRNKEEEVQFFFAMVEDITARKKALADLEKSLSVQNATLESTADGILVVDTSGKIVKYNRKFAKMWNIPDVILEKMEDEAALGFVLDQLKTPDDFINKVKYLYSSPEASSSDLLEFKDGRVFDRYSQPQRIGGEIVGRVWSFRDITERKKAETELIAAKEKAEESDRLKTAFLHNVSHEIRTPMNAILGFSALLNEPDVTLEDRNQFIEIIMQSGNQLLSIINDIVDLASIESGQMKVSMKKINLDNTLKTLYDQYTYNDKSREVILNLKTPMSQKDPEIMTDRTKLIQIISNLINNAYKFTREGSITFGYEIKDGFVEFFVRDTGIGIATEHQSRIFDRFYQVDLAVSRKFGGTGLGLSICKAYAELLGGKIWLESIPGKGTEFYFTIPYLKS